MPASLFASHVCPHRLSCKFYETFYKADLRHSLGQFAQLKYCCLNTTNRFCKHFKQGSPLFIILATIQNSISSWSAIDLVKGFNVRSWTHPNCVQSITVAPMFVWIYKNSTVCVQLNPKLLLPGKRITPPSGRFDVSHPCVKRKLFVGAIVEWFPVVFFCDPCDRAVMSNGKPQAPLSNVHA